MTEVALMLLSVPQVDPLQPLPDRDQITPLFWESFCTVALKACVPPVARLVEAGETATTIAVDASVVADAVLE